MQRRCLLMRIICELIWPIQLNMIEMWQRGTWYSGKAWKCLKLVETNMWEEVCCYWPAFAVRCKIQCNLFLMQRSFAMCVCDLKFLWRRYVFSTFVIHLTPKHCLAVPSKWRRFLDGAHTYFLWRQGPRGQWCGDLFCFSRTSFVYRLLLWSFPGKTRANLSTATGKPEI